MKVCVLGANGQLGDAVDVQRIRAIALDVGRVLGAVEDVVGADVHETRAELVTCAGEPPGGDRVHGKRLLRFGLAARDVVERGRVDDDRRLERAERPAHGVRVADLDRVVPEPPDVVAGERLYAVAAELAGRADDDDAPQKTPPILLSVSSISDSSSIHWML